MKDKIEVKTIEDLQNEYKEMVNMLRKENQELKLKVKTLQEKLTLPSEDAIKLEKELSQLKVMVAVCLNVQF